MSQMTYREKLRVTIETLEDEERIATDETRGATGDMSDEESALLELRAIVFRAAIAALKQILEGRREEETDGSADAT